MNNLTAYDYNGYRIDQETVQGDFVDRVAYSVIGVYTDYWGQTTEDILHDDLNSREYAEAWLRVYLERCAKDRDF
jgi:hypothetical protein